MKIKMIAAVSFFLLISGMAQAAPGYRYHHPAPEAGQQQKEGPDALLRQGMGELLEFMRQEPRPSQEAIGMFLESEIAPYFDFAYMAKWVTGRAYGRMNDEQRSAMESKVKALLLTTLTKRLGSYKNQDVRFYRPRRAGRGEVKVRVGILQAGGYPANVDFRFYKSKEGWKVFDVSANGSSAVSYYRKYFAQQMRQKRARAYSRY
jgi:phospholipid transport system substrate-binding protein